MPLRRSIFIWVHAVATLGPLTCAAQTVFTSIPPQAFVVEWLAGDLVTVEVLLPPGASPATYEPTPKQMAALDRSQLYLQIGAPFEGPVLTKVAEMMFDLERIDCRRGIDLEPMHSNAHHHGDAAFDPHIWLDPQRMKTIASTTAGALRELLPGQDSLIEERLSTLLTAIDASDRRVAEVLDPFAGRTVVVFHPAYGYFTRRYGLVQMAVEEDGKPPSARRMAKVIEELRGQGVPALFVQPQFSRSVAERVARALDCDLVELDPLAGDYLANLEAMAVRIAETLR